MSIGYFSEIFYQHSGNICRKETENETNTVCKTQMIAGIRYFPRMTDSRGGKLLYFIFMVIIEVGGL